MNWTFEQEQILREYGNLGAEECRKMIFRRTGVLRSVESTKRHAYRIGAPLIKYEICPSCGRKVRKLKPSGLCTVCNERYLAQKQRELVSKLEQQLKEDTSSHEYVNAKHEYDQARKAASRLRSKL